MSSVRQTCGAVVSRERFVVAQVAGRRVGSCGAVGKAGVGASVLMIARTAVERASGRGAACSGEAAVRFFFERKKEFAGHTHSLICQQYLLGGEDPRADLPAPFGTAARSYGRWWPPRWPSWPSRVGCMSLWAVGAIVGSLCLV